MMSKAFIAAALFIIGGWAAIQFIHIHSRGRTRSSRDLLISLTRNEIEKIEESINNNTDESISAKDLLNVIEINRLEGQIRDLKMKNFIDRSKSPEAELPEFFTIILLVAISMKIGLIDKKGQMNLPE